MECSDFRHFSLFEAIWYRTEGSCLKSEHARISDVDCIFNWHFDLITHQALRIRVLKMGASYLGLVPISRTQSASSIPAMVVFSK